MCGWHIYLLQLKTQSSISTEAKSELNKSHEVLNIKNVFAAFSFFYKFYLFYLISDDGF